MSWALLTVEMAARKKFGKSMKDLTAEEQEELKKAFQSGEFAQKKEESMNIKKIAHTLIALREGMSAFIMSGTLREELGFEGYGEALKRGWIQPDQESSGMVTITNNLGTVAEMRQLAEEYLREDNKCPKCGSGMEYCKCEKCPKCKHVECTCEGTNESHSGNVMSFSTFIKGNTKYHYNEKGDYVAGEAPRDRREEASPVTPKEPVQVKKPWYSESNDSAPLAQMHAFRTKLSLREISTMGIGNPERQATMPAQPSVRGTTTPTSQPPAAPGRQEPVNVGSNVRIVQDGKTYVGRIDAVKSDGKYTISFGGERPPVDRTYDKTEVTPVTDTVTK
jgi:hypothetical protein